MSVRVPPGVDDDDELRLHGKGEAGVRGAPPGDLFIKIQVSPHRMFQREGGNLRCEATVSIVEAALGGSLDLPMLGGGTARAKLKAGTQSGEVLRLRGKGVRTLRRAAPAICCVGWSLRRRAISTSNSSSCCATWPTAWGTRPTARSAALGSNASSSTLAGSDGRRRPCPSATFSAGLHGLLRDCAVSGRACPHPSTTAPRQI